MGLDLTAQLAVVKGKAFQACDKRSSAGRPAGRRGPPVRRIKRPSRNRQRRLFSPAISPVRSTPLSSSSLLSEQGKHRTDRGCWLGGRYVYSPSHAHYDAEKKEEEEEQGTKSVMIAAALHVYIYVMYILYAANIAIKSRLPRYL